MNPDSHIQNEISECVVGILFRSLSTQIATDGWRGLGGVG